MTRRMSCSMTVPAVRSRIKTVTRRRVDTWVDLKPGDRLTLIEKGMGLKKGARQRVLDEVEIVDVRVEPLGRIASEGRAGVEVEGLDMSPFQFIRFWAASHGYPPMPFHQTMEILCRRIEWRYLEEAVPGG